MKYYLLVFLLILISVHVSQKININTQAKDEIKNKFSFGNKESCNENCLSCENAICKICSRGMYALKNLCYEKCPEGFYADNYSFRCKISQGIYFYFIIKIKLNFY